MQHYKCIFGSPRFCVKLRTGNPRDTQQTDKTKDSMIMIELACTCTWISMHTKLIWKVSVGTCVSCNVEKPSGFQSPLAPLYLYLRCFYWNNLHVIAGYPQTFKITCKSTSYKCVQFHLIVISSGMSADFRLSEGMSYFRRDLKYWLFLFFSPQIFLPVPALSKTKESNQENKRKTYQENKRKILKDN